MDQLILENVTKQYNGTYILNQISHTFEAGQSAAFMGHNGCGKSTLLKIIAGLVKPTNGRINCTSPVLFHYVPEKFMPVPLTARTYLKRMGELDGMEKSQTGEQIETLGEEFFLSELLDIPMKHLSKGTLQKIGVIQALMKTPDVLLLDEPLSGQDIASQKVFIKKVNQMREDGVTVLMACHEPGLVEAVAEETYTICDGVLKAYQPDIEKMYALILENANKRTVLEGMERYGSGYKLVVREKEAQRVIRELLESGWNLKGMHDEKNNEFSETAAADLF